MITRDADSRVQESRGGKKIRKKGKKSNSIAPAKIGLFVFGGNSLGGINSILHLFLVGVLFSFYPASSLLFQSWLREGKIQRKRTNGGESVIDGRRKKKERKMSHLDITPTEGTWAGDCFEAHHQDWADIKKNAFLFLFGI